MIVGGVDLGTSGCKLTVYDGDRLLVQTRAAYAASRTGDMHSIHAGAVWERVQSLFREAVAKEPRAAELAAVAVSSFGEAAVPVDAEGNILGESLLFSDNNGREELAAIVEQVGTENIQRLCGVSPHPMYTICKMAWLKRHADYFPRVAHFLLFEDFIIHRLTGERAISHSLASRTMALDVEKLDWSEEIFNAAGLEPSLLSRPTPSGTVVGTVLPAVAEKLGVTGKMAVVTGGHDQMCAAVGGGAIREGVAVNGSGTVEALSLTIPSGCDRHALCSANYSYAIHADPGLRFTYAYCSSGSIVLNWYVKTFGLGTVGEFSAAVEKISVSRPTSLMTLPHFTGTGTPFLNADARGTVNGLSLETTKEELFVGLIEGLTYDLELNIDCLRELGIPLTAIHTAGGGSQSALWLQTKADVTGMPFSTLKNPEASALGCIMMAATAMGQYAGLEEAAAALVAIKETYEPDTGRHRLYREKTMFFRELYHSTWNAARRSTPGSLNQPQ